MPISVDPVTHIIDVPQDYLTIVSAGLYSLDTNQFREDLGLWAASESGRAEPFPYDHNTSYTVAGETYARKVELVNGYSWQAEDTGAFYSIRLDGSNNNLFDVANNIFIPHGNVMLIPQNAAGLIVVASGSGVTAQDKTDIINGFINSAQFQELYIVNDLHPSKPNTYNDDGSAVTNSNFTQDKTDNGNGTFTIQRS